MKKISIVVPTNNPDAVFNMLIPSLNHIDDLNRDHDVTFCIVHQDPWTDDEVKEAQLQFLKYGYKSVFTKSDMIGHMCNLRNAGIYAAECDYFMQIDDNFVFTSGTPQFNIPSGTRYSQVIEYMESYKECGLVQCEGSLGGSIQRLAIQSTKSWLFSTQRGIVYRFIKDFDYYGPCIDNPASAEESVIGTRVIERGYFFAKQFNNPTRHKTSNKKKLVPGSSSPIHDQAVIEANNVRYLRERYDDPSYTNNNNKIPKRLKELYIQNGGNPHVFESNQHVIDFER